MPRLLDGERMIRSFPLCPKYLFHETGNRADVEDLWTNQSKKADDVASTRKVPPPIRIRMMTLSQYRFGQTLHAPEPKPGKAP